MSNNSIQKDYIAIKLTDRLRAIFENALLYPSFSECVLQQIQSDLNNSMASISTLKLLSTVLTDHELYSAMKTSRLLFPNNKPIEQPTQAEEYKERMKYLIKKDEENKYNQMVYGCTEVPSSSESIAKQFSAIQNQASIGVNMIVSTLTAFGIAYYFASYYSKRQSWCMIVGLTVAIAVLLMEMILFIARASQLNEHTK